MDVLHKGWYTEFSPDDAERMCCGTSAGNSQKAMHDVDGEEMSGAWTGQAFSLHVDHILFQARSNYQDVLVFKRFSKKWEMPKHWLIAGE